MLKSISHFSGCISLDVLIFELIYVIGILKFTCPISYSHFQDSNQALALLPFFP